MRSKTSETVSVVTAAALMLTIGLVSLAGALRLAENAAEMAPQVGDVISFGTKPRQGGRVQSHLAVEREHQPGCLLDLAVLSGSGGSLLIISRSPRPGRIYHLQWTGPRTSLGSGDCGRSAELIVNDEELELLSSVAGGFWLGFR